MKSFCAKEDILCNGLLPRFKASADKLLYLENNERRNDGFTLAFEDVRDLMESQRLLVR
jgi:hypothetical protein